MALLVGIGCDTAPDNATGAKPIVAAQPPGILRLKPEMVAQAGIQVRPLIRGEFRTYRDFPGTVRPNENELAEITALVRGRVVDVYADLGQEVKAGTLLALLNSSELAMAQSSYLKAKARLHVAEQAFERATFLLKEKVIGRGEFQRRQGEMISFRAEAREARDRLQMLGMAEKDIRELESDETIRSFVPILAPFAGRIIARNVTRGEVVNTTEKLFVVADLSNVWVVANIPEKDIPYIQHSAARDRSVEILLSAYPHEVIRGTITYVGDVLDPATRTMKIRVEVTNPEGRLKPEMFASVRIYSEPEPNVLTIPSTAALQDKDETVVFVQLDDQQFARRAVKLDSESGDLLKVLDGLQEGDQVVVSGSFVLKSEFANQHQGGLVE
ncbi:MAG: efflux RND transporter periplasmic adaptor subunit [Nitrospirae bacterium]|nr:efflux RND transporter periplasmic adaptor subunit [Nitrospirota bacterium]